jgi:hypothetical protein
MFRNAFVPGPWVDGEHIIHSSRREERRTSAKTLSEGSTADSNRGYEPLKSHNGVDFPPAESALSLLKKVLTPLAVFKSYVILQYRQLSTKGEARPPVRNLVADDLLDTASIFLSPVDFRPHILSMKPLGNL